MFNIYKEKVKINQEEIDKQIINYIENNPEVKELKISEIEINLDKESNLQKEIDFIKKEIQENGFENTALKFSIASSAQDLGDIGWINTESLSPKISKALKNLNKGDISKPIKNPNTLLFFKTN